MGEEQLQCYLEENVPVRTVARVAVVVEIVEIQTENANSLFLPTLKNGHKSELLSIHRPRSELAQRRRKAYTPASLSHVSVRFCSLLPLISL